VKSINSYINSTVTTKANIKVTKDCN